MRLEVYKTFFGKLLAKQMYTLKMMIAFCDGRLKHLHLTMFDNKLDPLQV